MAVPVGLSVSDVQVLKIPLSKRMRNTSYSAIRRLNSGCVQEMVTDVAAGDGVAIIGALGARQRMSESP